MNNHGFITAGAANFLTDSRMTEATLTTLKGLSSASQEEIGRLLATLGKLLTAIRSLDELEPYDDPVSRKLGDVMTEQLTIVNRFVELHSQYDTLCIALLDEHVEISTAAGNLAKQVDDLREKLEGVTTARRNIGFRGPSRV